MKKTILLVLSLMILGKVYSQIDPLVSPYYQNGPYTVVMDSVMNSDPNDMLIFRPSTNSGGPYPTILFQPGANGSGTSYINKHSYDLYWSHLASYGFVVFIINNTSGGPNSTLFTDEHDWIKTNVSNTSSWMHTYVDLNRFIAAGHSNGGMNATDIIINRPNEIQGIIYMASYPNPGMFGFGSQNVSSYNGKVMLLNGDEDDTSVPLVGSTNSVSLTAYQSKFSAVSCKTRVLFEGIGHGGFGDYNNPDQPVGTIGRNKVTASIRHYLVSFLTSQFKFDALGYNNLNNSLVRPNSVGEYENTCSIVMNENTITYNENILVYPVPARDKINISFTREITGYITIYNSLGSQMYIDKIENTSGIDLTIDSFKAGMYIINVTDNSGKTFSRKFVVE